MAAVTVAACLPSALYVIRNVIVTGTPHGPVLDPGLKIFGDIALATETWQKDLGFSLSILFILSLAILLKNKTSNRPSALIVISIIMAYVGIILYGTSTDTVMPIGTRYFVPMYPLVLVFISIVLSGVRQYRSVIQTAALSLLIFGIVENQAESCRPLEKIASRNNGHAWHNDAGFNQTVTAKKIRNELSQSGDLHFTVLYDSSDKKVQIHRQRLGRTLLFRSCTLPGNILSYNFGNNEDFSIQFENGQIIHYHEIKDINNPKELVSELRKLPLGTEVWVMGPLRYALVKNKKWDQVIDPLASVIKPHGILSWSYWQYTTIASADEELLF